MYTLDTNAVIYFLNGDKRARPFLEEIFSEGSESIYISSITELELFSYPYLSDNDENDLDKLIATFAIISLDSRLARIAAWLRRYYGIKTADSVIAATALFTKTALVTRNIKDFNKITELSIIKI